MTNQNLPIDKPSFFMLCAFAVMFFVSSVAAGYIMHLEFEEYKRESLKDEKREKPFIENLVGFVRQG